MTVEKFKQNHPNVSTVLSEWCGTEESENLAISHAFSLFELKKVLHLETLHMKSKI